VDETASFAVGAGAEVPERFAHLSLFKKNDMSILNY
jgi:hypothetical protein